MARLIGLDVGTSSLKGLAIDHTGAVLGEYNKSFANPGLVMDEALRQLVFKTHTYGHTTLGFTICCYHLGPMFPGMLDEGVLSANVAAIRGQLGRFLDFGPGGALLPWVRARRPCPAR